MDLLRLSIFMLLAFIGCVKCADQDDIPDCNFYDLAACSEGAIRSYTRNTRGEAAAQGPLNPEDAQTVGLALSADVTSPSVNLNESCKVVRKVAYQDFIDCIIDATTGCKSYPPTEDDFPDIIPSVRYSEFQDYADFDVNTICTEACLSYRYNIKARMVQLIRCWKEAKLALTAARHGYVSPHHCQVLSDYMLCQWDNARDCELLADITRIHFLTLLTTIAECDIPLPKEALRKRGDTTDPPITASSARVTPPPLVVHVSVLFVILCTVCGRYSTSGIFY